MTNLWKSSEIYTFDIPPQRINDVCGKNAYCSLATYLRLRNPKITDVRFDPKYPLVHVEVAVPKYPKERPYFTNQDTHLLLETYMEYANMQLEELQKKWLAP